ncbi:MAG: DEAD/DEAH box helicase, partial [Deltaproteobacteria bacterium]|nr:DEAD/DEAH box helicase [Deltaproteobacteria bacterium]
AARHFLFIDPDTGPANASARLFAHALKQGQKTIVFTQARKATELIHTWSMRMIPAYRDRISSYRAGFLPEERREIERGMASGKLLGVISTSALEMGIDIGALDVCILVGYPGTVARTWQRGGRVGRSDRESAILMVASPDALDQYFVRHPES